MPPHLIAGNVDLEWVPVQDSYPYKFGARTRPNENKDYPGVKEEMLSPHPVHPPGHWSVQGVETPVGILPCYFTATFDVPVWTVHFNIGAKPDITVRPDGSGDWHWGFPEFSLTFQRRA